MLGDPRRDSPSMGLHSSMGCRVARSWDMESLGCCPASWRASLRGLGFAEARSCVGCPAWYRRSDKESRPSMGSWARESQPWRLCSWERWASVSQRGVAYRLWIEERLRCVGARGDGASGARREMGSLRSRWSWQRRAARLV